MAGYLLRHVRRQMAGSEPGHDEIVRIKRMTRYASPPRHPVGPVITEDIRRDLVHAIVPSV